MTAAGTGDVGPTSAMTSVDPWTQMPERTKTVIVIAPEPGVAALK